MEYTFRLTGRFKPYVRMTQRSKYADPEARAYLASKGCLGFQMLEQMAASGRELIPRGIPLAVAIVIQPARHNCDLDNQIKALLDAAQGIVFEDDRWVDFIFAFRHGKGEDVVDFMVTDDLAGFISNFVGWKTGLATGMVHKAFTIVAKDAKSEIRISGS